MTYGINLRSGRTLFVKVGEVAEGYKVMTHDPKATEGDVLVLEKGPEQLRLVKGKDLQQFDTTADLILMLDRKRYNNIAKDSTVKIRDVLYNVIDITTNAVTIRGPQPGNDVTVHLISDTERNEVLGEGVSEHPEGVPTGTVSGVVPRPPVIRPEGPTERPPVVAPVVPARRPRGRGI
ncbi:MAG: hypothetical protein NTY53_12060 [Kiritimatiellaeota bacterium]|nr:hypothetical protein [Kiritimatiellota bacterium]